ncbi:hypothetical protein PF005_g6615 [Phytophthora fragariae]|uniref:Uncharacterized protein n=1 Tax=Phytophthora fragariae TaxID=53985 RepID=A0A6A3UHJ6_9STRA|nr:hypothetical protein PF006_g5956 [Phytophthora fragariae]KAE9222685.1 hypothetical protein PF005_g6615 [Phytophthora fragariae]KAE9318501.1 hypothetical protein PF001_g6342 [Phytophthora fragariae]
MQSNLQLASWCVRKNLASLLKDDGNGEDSSAYVHCVSPGDAVRPSSDTSFDQQDREVDSAAELKLVRFAPGSADEVSVDIGHDRLGSILHAPDIQWTLRTRAFRTCLVLAMPWAAYAILDTVFTNTRLSYMESMGISDFVPRFVPSLIQFFLGPILGAMSDRSLSKWGRRNVFLMAAAVVVTVTGLLYGSANVLFPSIQYLTKLLLVLLSVGVLLLNIGLRARVMDMVPIEFQVHAQATLAMYEGVGGVLGSLLFRSTSDAVVFASAISGKEILKAFGFAMAAIFVTTAVCICLRPEHPQDKPIFQPRLSRIGREAWQQVVHAPKVFRFLCVVYFVLSFAWLSFSDEVYQWWGANVYGGCKAADCDDDSQLAYKRGLNTANTALIAQNGLVAVICFIVLLIMPRVPDASYLKRFTVLGLAIGTCALVVAVSVGSFSKEVAFAGFVITAFYQTVANIFPFSVVGIMGKELQTSVHGFNNNGLYVGVLMLFEAASDLTVQVYGTESLSPLGTGNVLTLPCILFAVGIAFRKGFTVLQVPACLLAPDLIKERQLVLDADAQSDNAGSWTPKMATETQRPALPHELAVTHDERHSYMQRMHSLVGPGAYIIPSTFHRPTPNLLLRVVQREQYGREFSRQKRLSTAGTPALQAAPAESALEPPCQLCLVTVADTHRARRDELRRLLAPVGRWGEDASSPSDQRAAADGKQRSPRASPRPRAGSPPRRRWTSAELADIVADFGEQPASAADEEQEDGAALAARMQQQLGSFRTPLTYQHFLMSTSYLERLRRQQQQQQR